MLHPLVPTTLQAPALPFRRVAPCDEVARVLEAVLEIWTQRRERGNEKVRPRAAQALRLTDYHLALSPAVGLGITSRAPGAHVAFSLGLLRHRSFTRPA